MHNGILPINWCRISQPSPSHHHQWVVCKNHGRLWVVDMACSWKTTWTSHSKYHQFTVIYVLKCHKSPIYWWFIPIVLAVLCWSLAAHLGRCPFLGSTLGGDPSAGMVKFHPNCPNWMGKKGVIFFLCWKKQATRYILLKCDNIHFQIIIMINYDKFILVKISLVGLGGLIS